MGDESSDDKMCGFVVSSFFPTHEMFKEKCDFALTNVTGKHSFQLKKNMFRFQYEHKLMCVVYIFPSEHFSGQPPLQSGLLYCTSSI